MWAGPGSVVTDRPPSLLRDYRPEYERLRQQLADAQAQKQQQQLDRLRKDMGAVAMTAAPPTGSPLTHTHTRTPPFKPPRLEKSETEN